MCVFFFNDTAATEISTLSLHYALPFSVKPLDSRLMLQGYATGVFPMAESRKAPDLFWVEPRERAILPIDGFHLSRSLAKRSEEHTSELQSRQYLVCRLLLEKKNSHCSE